MRISIQKAIAEALLVELDIRVQHLTGWDPSPEVIPMAESNSWILAFRVGDLNPNGFVAVSRAQIRSIKTSNHLVFRKRVLKSEGLWPQMQRRPRIDLTSAATILASLRKQKQLAIVLSETFDDWYSIHCRVDQITSDHAALRGFDGAAKWERRPTRVALCDITRIYFGSRYLKLYQKHLPKID